MIRAFIRKITINSKEHKKEHNFSSFASSQDKFYISEKFLLQILQCTRIDFSVIFHIFMIPVNLLQRVLQIRLQNQSDIFHRNQRHKIFQITVF